MSRLYEEHQTSRKKEQLDQVKIELFLQLTICRITSGTQSLNDCQLYMIEKEGFPVYRDPFRRGNLIIQILIDPITAKGLSPSQEKNVDRIKKLFNVLDFEEKHPDATEVFNRFSSQSFSCSGNCRQIRSQAAYPPVANRLESR